jgi:ArsR family transcriptional regulator
MREMVKISKALADESRIRMLKLLLERDICVREMQEILHLSQPQVSRNLKILMDAGFLKRWREGKCIVYFAERNNNNRFCKAILDTLAESFNDNTVAFQDKERLQQVIEQQVRKKAE